MIEYDADDDDYDGDDDDDDDERSALEDSSRAKMVHIRGFMSTKLVRISCLKLNKL